MKLMCLVVFISVLPICSANAGSIYGPGNYTCGNYLKTQERANSGDEVEAAKFLGMLNWFYGFATSVSLSTDIDLIDDDNSDAIVSWFDNYCKENPLDKFFLASVHLLGELKDKRE